MAIERDAVEDVLWRNVGGVVAEAWSAGARQRRGGALRVTWSSLGRVVVDKGFRLLRKARRDRSSVHAAAMIAVILSRSLGLLDVAGQRVIGRACLLLGALTRSLDAVPALDHVRLEAYRARAAVQLEEQATGVAEDGTDLIASPERSGAGGAVAALGNLLVVRSQSERGRHGGVVGGGLESRKWMDGVVDRRDKRLGKGPWAVRSSGR